MSDTILVVAVYDVTDNRRRQRLFQLLKRYGVPAQKSAFEARLTTRERETLLRDVHRLLDADCDKFTLYPIASPQERGIQHIGPPRPDAQNPDYYLV